MPDYIQLLESKLSPNQKQALNAITDVARGRGVPVFLTGGAVRDLVSGASVRDLDMTVQSNPLKFRKDLEKAGFSITGEHAPSQTLYLRFGHQARLEISASRWESFPKPARPEYRPAAILDDLHRRDFTANAMALSLNEGSWGLLLDPLNGTADISARQLRLVSNYGFLEDPIRLVRATRLLSRTGWDMEEPTRTRYENAKAEGVISAITPVQCGYELEEIAYEEEPLQAIRALEAEGWMKELSSTWNSRSADAQGIERLHERLVKLLMAGLQPDPSPAQFRLLSAKLAPAQMKALKHLFVRTDLVEQADALDREAKKVLQQISGREAAKPSQLWRLLHTLNPQAVLWLFFTNKTATVQNRFESFFSNWPEARQKIPNAILQDMRIVPDIAGYDELLDKLTFAFMDAELPNEEAVRKFAAPYSPPAPPPPVVVRRGRTVKKVVEPKGSKKGRRGAKKLAEPLPGEAETPAAETPEIAAAASAADTAGVAEKPVRAAGKQGAVPAKPAKATASGKAERAAKAAPAEKAATTKAKPGKAESSARSSAARPKSEKAAVSKTSGKGEKPAARISGPTHKASMAANPGAKAANARPTAKAAKSAPAKAHVKSGSKSTIARQKKQQSSGAADGKKSAKSTTKKASSPQGKSAGRSKPAGHRKAGR